MNRSSKSRSPSGIPSGWTLGAGVLLLVILVGWAGYKLGNSEGAAVTEPSITKTAQPKEVQNTRKPLTGPNLPPVGFSPPGSGASPTGPGFVGPPPPGGPEMKAAMENAIKNTTNKMFGGFFAGLSPEKRAKAEQIMYEGQRKMIANLEAGKPPPPIEEIKQQQLQQEAQLKELLGEEGYAGYQQYRKTIPDRRDLQSASEKAAAAGMPLSTNQEQELLKVMTAARDGARNTLQAGLATASTAAPLPSVQGQGGGNPQDFQAIKTQMDTYQTQLKASDEQVLSGASSILSPEQTAVLKEVLETSRNRAPGGMAAPGR